MYIPHTPNGPKIYTFNGGIFENVRDTLKAVGWEQVAGDEPYTWLKATSPQGIWTKLRMRQVNLGYYGLNTEFTFGNASQGATYYVRELTGNFQIVANCCQFFMSTVGVEADLKGSTISGGIPFIPPSSLPYGECWWSTGDGILSPFYASSTFRQALLNKVFQAGTYLVGRDAFFNGVYCGGYDTGSPRLETFVCAGGIDYTSFDQLANINYLDDSPIYLPALISWGDTSVEQHKVRGLLWDAMVGTIPAVLDSQIMYDTQNWINFTHEYYYGSLYLLLPSIGFSNYSY